jgi:ATP-binding cassette, subfamily C, bacteriocin exporter
MKKAVRIKQRDLSDCGAACLASVAAYYGLRIPVSRIRQYAGTDKMGTSLYGLMEAAERLHFQARGAKISGMPLRGIPVPTIFHLVLENGLQHFVVVYRIKKDRVRYMDPAIGQLIKQSLPVFLKRFSGAILLILPSERFQQGGKKKSVSFRFWQLILPHQKLLIQALAGALVYTVLALALSVYVQKIIDFVLPDANKHLMNLLSLAMIVLLFFRVITGYLKSVMAVRTGLQIDCRLILGYFRHLLELPQRFFDHMRVGEIISRMNDAVRVRVFINDTALGILVHVLTMVLSITAMFIYNWKLALVMMLTAPVYILIYLVSDRVNAKWQRKAMETGAALESQLVESVQGMTTICRFNAQEYFYLKTEKRIIPLLRIMFAGSRKGLLLANATEWITGLVTVVTLWYGSFLVIDQVMSPGELLSFYTLTSFFTTPVQALIGANRTMQDALIAADRLFEIIDLEKENKEQHTLDRCPEGDLIFENIHFSYGHGNPVFSGLQFRILQNQMTAIIGESGCGKSTLLALIQKFYALDAGSIQIGDTDIRYISTPAIRKRITAVSQQTDLFQGTIISNIALGEPDPDLERIINICQRLGIHEYITRLPERYHSIIHEQGINLSGGQKQKLGIARALYPDPAILILDEATSALDPESEEKVKETLRWFYAQKKTIVIISHRLSTIRFCESVIFLKQGHQALCGKHEHLLSEYDQYAEWWAHGR